MGSMEQRTVAASGTVTVRDIITGDEWKEIVEVFERDIEEDFGVEDVAATVAIAQAEPNVVEVLEYDLS